MTYSFASNTIGCSDVTVLTTIAPGIGNLPSTILESQLGEIRTAWDPVLGFGEFIYLQVPINTTFAAGNVVQWSAGVGIPAYTAALLPVLATSKNTGHAVAICPVAVASNTVIQYGWFQVSGQNNVLKTAVTVTPDSTVYASGTAGRIKVLTSAGGQIWGMRTANTATVTSTTSTVLCFLNRSAMIEGQIS